MRATNPFLNPAVACELTLREREALMAADDWDPILDKVLSVPGVSAKLGLPPWLCGTPHD